MFRAKVVELGRLVSLEMGKILAEGIGEVQVLSLHGKPPFLRLCTSVVLFYGFKMIDFLYANLSTEESIDNFDG